ncbi:hypothetical protein EJ03DRAFT_350290 [Teratosphaeria nubilosa]|uniref:Uncharacterized protein n=1 Tax=Teratosphaeria nubilosa TaxID=161662 RepID=A0A6G1LEX0_9PEZI|nr:hypothetical protein EJ03DRAFT_350290 [Teratosphaeria nubilosa]
MATLPIRSGKKATEMAGLHEFPALFTIDASNRHEIILVNPGHELNELRTSIEALVASSPNCAEFMGKYKSKESKDVVKQIKVRWSSEGRDKQLFPKETLLTEDNCEPILRMMAVGVGKDVFDVKLEAQPTAATKH